MKPFVQSFISGVVIGSVLIGIYALGFFDGRTHAKQAMKPHECVSTCTEMLEAFGC